MEKRFDFLNTLGHLQCSTAYIGAGVHRGRHTVDRIPYSRLFFVKSAPDGDRPGFVGWGSGNEHRHLELYGDNVYFAPKGVELELRILPGTEIATIHYLLEVFYGYDLFESTTECAKVPNPGSICSEVYESLSRPSALSEYMSVLARILDISGRFLEADGEEFRRIVTLRQRYAPVVRLLQKSHNQQLRVQELADAMNMDRSTFSKRFLHDIGLTPKDYLTQLLMRRAADLVSGTSRKLSEIAEELNFSDEYYFSRFFKKHFGRQPSVFRNMYVGLDTSRDIY